MRCLCCGRKDLHNRRLLVYVIGLLIALVSATAHSASISFQNSLYMGAWSPFATSYDLVSPVCTWTDQAGSNYKIIASNVEPVGDFNLENGTASLLAYRIFWQDQYNALAWNELQPDIESSDSYQFDNSAQCGGGNNTALKVEVDKVDFDNAAAGIYSGTIMLTLVPQ